MFLFSYLRIPRWGLISIFELCVHIYRERTSSLYFQNLQNKHRDANKKFQNVTEKVIGWGPPLPRALLFHILGVSQVSRQCTADDWCRKQFSFPCHRKNSIFLQLGRIEIARWGVLGVK